jgi:hypothetical protein
MHCVALQVGTDKSEGEGEGEGKVVPVILTEHHAIKAYLESGSITPLIL